MANWNRVWSSQCNNSCSTDCFNIRGPSDVSSGKPTAFDGLTTNITSLADVTAFYAEEIKKRTSASRYVITGTTSTSFVVVFKIHRQNDKILTIQYSSAEGTMPVAVTFSGGYSANIYSMTQMVDWVVDKM